MTRPSTTAAEHPGTTDAEHPASPGPSNKPGLHRNQPHRRRTHTRDELIDTVIALVTFGALPLDGANDLLHALGLGTINGDDKVTFRVTAAILADYDTPARTIRNATGAARDQARQMRWTRLDGCPDGYAIDPPTHDPSQPDQPWTTVHTDLYLIVTVPAYRRGDLITTAYALLAQDLLADPDGLVTFRTDRITVVRVKPRARSAARTPSTRRTYTDATRPKPPRPSATRGDADNTSPGPPRSRRPARTAHQGYPHHRRDRTRPGGPRAAAAASPVSLHRPTHLFQPPVVASPTGASPRQESHRP